MYRVKVTIIFLCSVMASVITGYPVLLIELHVPDQLSWVHTAQYSHVCSRGLKVKSRDVLSMAVFEL